MKTFKTITTAIVSLIIASIIVGAIIEVIRYIPASGIFRNANLILWTGIWSAIVCGGVLFIVAVVRFFHNNIITLTLRGDGYTLDELADMLIEYWKEERRSRRKGSRSRVLNFEKTALKGSMLKD